MPLKYKNTQISLTYVHTLIKNGKPRNMAIENTKKQHKTPPKYLYKIHATENNVQINN